MSENSVSTKKSKIMEFLDKGILLDYNFLEKNDESSFVPKQEILDNTSILTIDKEELFYDKENINNDEEMDKLLVQLQKGRDIKSYNKLIEIMHESTNKAQHSNSQSSSNDGYNVKIISSYNEKPKKREVQDFVNYFIARYKFMEKILRNRQELKSVTSISRILQKKEKETLSLIGIVKSRQQTKNENIELVLEDLTGEIKVIVNKSKTHLFELAKNLSFDEVIGAVGVNSTRVVFANNIILPDVPQKEIKKAQDETYALFLSDTHIGSKNFLKEKFERFLKWINGESGNEQQQEIAKKTKYLFIVGDLVDGVGIYPSQENDLNITDVEKQYEECARLFSQIPKHIKIIISGGNHDALRLAEPQPAFCNYFIKSLLELPNVIMVSNPAVVNIHSSENFSGFDVLLYHGYSFDYYIANVSSIRFGGGYDRADLVMKYLLQRRHLAPTHSSAPYIPDNERDPLIIEQVPDFFVTGHLHKTSVAQYKSTTLICGSCWQDLTSFQIKVGHHPEPCRVPMVNLQTREMRILRF